jgi:hypothetical protein
MVSGRPGDPPMLKSLHNIYPVVFLIVATTLEASGGAVTTFRK